MKDVFEEYESASDRINALRNKSIQLPEWGTLLHDYEPKYHDIVDDKDRIRDRDLEDGKTEKASRIYIGLEKLLTSRYVDFTFAIPVKRIYHNTDEEGTDVKKRKSIEKAIERIYKYARIDSENIKRGRALYAACEFCTIWYTVKQKNNLYGFETNYKLKCRTYSPMEGVKLYPLFDETDDMVAMSFEYERKDGTEKVNFFETYTATKHVKWRQKGSDWEEDEFDKDITILSNTLGKIPGVYAFRQLPVYAGLTNIRSEIEYALSRNANIISYNAAPVLEVAGEVQGQEKRDEGYRIFRVESGGHVSYVSWNQSTDALKYQVEQLLKFYFMQAQMPDISADRMMSLGNIGYDARQTILTDAHLKIGEEAGTWIETFEREANVVKAFLKQMQPDWSADIDEIEIEHVITPFIQNDEKSEIQKWSNACGGKPVMSQLSAIKSLGYATNAAEEFDRIQEETKEEQASKMASFFGGGSAE